MKNYPFIGYSLVFISGILANRYFPIFPELYLILLFILLIISVASHFSIQNNHTKYFSVLGFYFFFFILGNYLHAIKVENKSFLPDNIKSVEKLIVIGSVESIELRKDKEITFEIKTDSIRINNAYQKKEVYLICRVKDIHEDLIKLYEKLHPENKVRIEAAFQKGRDARNPGEFNYEDYLKSKGISGLLYVNDEYDVKLIDWDYSFFLNAIFSARKFVDSKIKSLHNEQAAGLLRGLLLADRSGINYETKMEFVNSGVMHILAVSGLHVGYIVLIFIAVFGRFNVYTRSILTIVGLIAFLLLTGMPASVFRAVVMAVVIIFAYMTNRSTNIFNSLAIAAFIVLIVNPEEIFGAGFQLSFLAVLSIAIIYPIIQRFINSLRLKSKIINYTLLFMGVSLSAQIGTLPLTLIYFGKLSIISLFTNLIVIPLAGVIVAIGIFSLTLSTFIIPIAGFYASANEIIIFALFKIISFAGSSQYSFIPVNNFTLYDSLFFYAAIILLVLGIKKLNTKKAKISFAILVIANAIIFSSFDRTTLFEKGKLNVIMIDVSRNYTVLIKFPNEKTVLINAGYSSFYFDNGARIIRPLLNHLEIDKIDYAFVLSVTQANVSGFISLIKHGVIKSVIKPLLDSNSLVDLKFEEFLNNHNLSIKYFNKEVLEIDGVRVYFMNIGNSKSSTKNIYDKSSIIKVVYGNTSYLFPGDIENEIEYLYCDEYKNFLKSDVLVIANNGSIKSSSLEFLQTVQPKISLISVENQNKFGSTSSIILERLEKIGSSILRTDKEGAILLKSDGVNLSRVKWN